MNTAIDTVQQYIPLAAATAGTASDVFVVCGLPGKSKVRAVRYVSDGGVTADDTDYATFTATVDGTTIGAASTTTAGTGDIADGGVAALSLTAAGSNLLAEGEAVKVAITKPGNGVAISGALAVTFERVRAD